MAAHMNQIENSDWKQYSLAAQKRASELDNRGPMRFDQDGFLQKDILDAYFRTGFYVFTGVIARDEIAELKEEFDRVLDNAPVSYEHAEDSCGRPVVFDVLLSVFDLEYCNIRRRI